MAGILPGLDPRKTAATAAVLLALALPVQASDLTKTVVGTSPSPGGNPNPVSPISNAPGGNLPSATPSNVANGKVCVLVGLRTVCGTPHEFFMASSRACATSQPPYSPSAETRELCNLWSKARDDAANEQARRQLQQLKGDE